MNLAKGREVGAQKTGVTVPNIREIGLRVLGREMCPRSRARSWWHMSGALRTSEAEVGDGELESSLGYIASSRPA